ncbi:hypothetical protein ACTWPB_11625 [Nocardia sp. IBHARD005]|uniref:hypothetical protein n=1 Tax=Nocardia sp. IBHARD005 TaxID=3457765 RepID=UPI004059B892
MKSALLILAALIAATACGSSGGGKVEVSPFTAAQAQQRIHENLSAALTGLPLSLNLSKNPENSALASFGRERPVSAPCWDASTQSSGPYNLSSSYWVTGVPKGENRKYFDAMLDAWEKQGWPVERESRFAANTTLLEGFGLQLQDAGKGDGSLSVTGYSPCVDQSTIEGVTKEPDTIVHS